MGNATAAELVVKFENPSWDVQVLAHELCQRDNEVLLPVDVVSTRWHIDLWNGGGYGGGENQVREGYEC